MGSENVFFFIFDVIGSIRGNNHNLSYKHFTLQPSKKIVPFGNKNHPTEKNAQCEKKIICVSVNKIPNAYIKSRTLDH